MPRQPDIDTVRRLLNQPRSLPQDPVRERVVMWKGFRTLDAAATYSTAVMLGQGQEIVAGKTSDSIGDLYWIGVRVDDLAKWGNTKAIQLTDGFDAEDPDVQGRPFEKR